MRIGSLVAATSRALWQGNFRSIADRIMTARDLKCLGAMIIVASVVSLSHQVLLVVA